VSSQAAKVSIISPMCVFPRKLTESLTKRFNLIERLRKSNTQICYNAQPLF
jgi:hypothetical protein